jgi:hypothetical protein
MRYSSLVRKFAKKIYFLKYGKDLNRQDWYIKEEYDSIVKDMISEVPPSCPVYQCGGFMKRVVRRPPKGFNYDDEYLGDEHTPDLVCGNCSAHFKFSGFGKHKKLVKKNGGDKNSSIKKNNKRIA